MKHHHESVAGLREFSRWHCLQPARLCVVLLLMFSVCGCVIELDGQPNKPREYQVKAAYLYRFAKFVKWPPNVANQSTFTLCVLGQDPFGPDLETILSGESMDGKTVSARRISSVDDSLSCRILFISASEEGRLTKVLSSLEHAGVLTVSDIPGFAERGGMIEFLTVGDRVRFEVNRSAAQIAGLTLSSELLKVAMAVRGAP